MFNFESTSFSNFAFSTSRFGEDIFTVVASNNRLSMAEYNIGFVAATAFNIHKVWVRGRDQSFQFVRLSFVLKGGVEEVSIHLWNLNILLNILILTILFTLPKYEIFTKISSQSWLGHGLVFLHHFEDGNVNPQNLAQLLGSSFVGIVSGFIEVVTEILLKFLCFDAYIVYLPYSFL
jgi:hypothetical protein